MLIIKYSCEYEYLEDSGDKIHRFLITLFDQSTSMNQRGIHSMKNTFDVSVYYQKTI